MHTIFMHIPLHMFHAADWNFHYQFCCKSLNYFSKFMLIYMHIYDFQNCILKITFLIYTHSGASQVFAQIGEVEKGSEN